MAEKSAFQKVQDKVASGLSKLRTALKTIPYAFQNNRGFSVIDELQGSEQFEYFLLKEEVREHEVFSRFEVFITKRAAVFHSFNGFWVSVDPYSKGWDGHAHDTTLYQWLENLVATKRAVIGNEDKNVAGSDTTYKDLLEADELVTWANLMQPTVIFSDVNKAFEAANEYAKWLLEQSKKLEEAMSAPPSEPDLRADVEAEAAFEAKERFMELIPDKEEDEG